MKRRVQPGEILYGTRANALAAGTDLLAYVESMDSIVTPAAILDPLGARVPFHGSFRQRLRRVRFSAVDARSFRRLAPRFEELRGSNLTAAQRRRRRADVLALGRETPLPIVDIYSPWHGTEEICRLSRGLWVHLLLLGWDADDRSVPVHMGDPDFEGDTGGAFSLGAIRVVDEALDSLLRDIFSLAHVGDLGSEGEDGEGGAAPQPQPGPHDDGGNPQKPHQSGIRILVRAGDVDAPGRDRVEAAFRQYDVWRTESDSTCSDPYQQAWSSEEDEGERQYVMIGGGD